MVQEGVEKPALREGRRESAFRSADDILSGGRGYAAIREAPEVLGTRLIWGTSEERSAVDIARLAWEDVLAKDVPPDVAARLPADAEAVQDVVRLVKLAKEEGMAPRLVELVQGMREAMAAGERVPSVEESVPPEVFQLIDDIARNQVFGEGDRLVIGKYESQQTGYIGAARNGGGLYYNTNPAVWNALKEAFGDQARDVSWLINQRVLELYAYEKQPVFMNQSIDPEIEVVKDVWNNPGKTEYASARFWEIRWLRSQGFEMEPILDEAGKTIGFRFVPPGGEP